MAYLTLACGPNHPEVRHTSRLCLQRRLVVYKDHFTGFTVQTVFIPVQHDGGGAAVHVTGIVGTVFHHNVDEVGVGGTQGAGLTAVDTQEDNSTVGTLTDDGGRTYDSLFWEAVLDAEYDLSHGFCVAGKDTAAFLEETLAALGLSEIEANAFIVYWLPRMQENPYNLITFQTTAYTDAAELDIEPAPDTVIRVFMVWQALDAELEIPAQILPKATAREGFTVVEWGGTEIMG